MKSKNHKLKATIKLKQKQQKDSVIYYDDLLQQKEFSLEDWRKAKRKYPFGDWVRSKMLFVRTILEEVKFAFIRLKLRMIK
jgi:hypothetical protein